MFVFFVQKKQIVFVFTSPLLPHRCEVTEYISERGDAVKDIAFWVDDAKGIWEKATKRGAKSVSAPKKYSDKNGSVMMAKLETYGKCIHTLVENINYKGPFLPEFEPVDINADALQVESHQSQA